LPPVKERLSEAELVPIIEKYDGIICGDDSFTKKVLQKAKKLKVIVKWGTGIDSIDQEAAKHLGIPVYNTPNAFSEPVSDTVMGFVLSFSRNISRSDQMMKSGGWEKILCYSLSEQTIGIIGIGNVGRLVARKANAFGMQIYGNDIKEIPEEMTKSLNITMVDKETLLGESDYVSLNCTLNETSYHLISKPQLQFMKNTAILINTARGNIVNEPDLIKALENKIIAGAALDVFEVEPLPQDSPLRRFENCLLSSHNSNSSPLYWQK
ncbi:unnamed protein product, partial [marine sediment metagenome]